MIYCLDTSVVIAAIRNRGPVIAAFRSRGLAALKVPEIVRAELLLGCLKCAQPERERAKVDYVIAPFERIPFGADAAEHYAAIRRDLEGSGTPIGPNAMLIAATARALGAVMVTANRSAFSRVPGLVVEDWTR